MNKGLWGIMCLLVCVSKNTYAQKTTLLLNDAFKHALVHNQSDEVYDARIDSATAGYEKSKGNYLPKIALKGTYTFLDQLNDQKTMSLNLAQNLFKGGRDQVSISGQSLNIETQKLTKSIEQLVLFKEVADVYFTHWQNELDEKNLLLLKEQSEKRRNEIRSRVKIGRSRRGELLQAESQLATVESNLLNAQGLKEESSKKLSNLLGVNEFDLYFPEIVDEPRELESLESYLDKSQSRMELTLKNVKLQIADLDLDSSKRNHLPTLDLSSNYYLNKRSGSYRNSDWDLSFNLSVPLFEGGSTEALVRESVAKKTEAFLAINDQKRKIEGEVKVKYEAARKYLAQLKAGMRAFVLAKENYDEALKDYRLGLVSNLDTLSALNTYLDAKRTYDRTKIQAKAALENLNLTVGIKP